MSAVDRVLITWETTVVEHHSAMVEVANLPADVRRAIDKGQILTTDRYTDTEAHDHLIGYVCDVETEETQTSVDVTDREITAVIEQST